MSESSTVQNSDILIVDDNVQNAELLEAYLEVIPCNTRIAADGVEAMEMIEERVPDLILLDIMMPRMSGFEVCRRVKGNAQTKDVPVVMVTALTELADVERSIDCGADEFLSKPINKLELVTRVKSLLRVRHMSSELERALSLLAELDAEKESDEE